MDHVVLMLHLAAVCWLSVRVVATGNIHDIPYSDFPYGADNGHSAKKSPMDYTRYAEEALDIVDHNNDDSSQPVNTCDDRYDVNNLTIIRTKDSMTSGAKFIGDTKVLSATDCRWQCCNDEGGSCDTAIFIEDSNKNKDKNCFMFQCRFDETLKCHFASHAGYVSAMVAGFDGVPSSHVMGLDDELHVDAGGEDAKLDDMMMKVVNKEDDDDVTEYKEKMPPSHDKSSDNGTPVSDRRECRGDQSECANGECITAHYVCNDIKDCSDGSDEMGCKYRSWKQRNDFNRPDDTYQSVDHGTYDENEEDGASKDNHRGEEDKLQEEDDSSHDNIDGDDVHVDEEPSNDEGNDAATPVDNVEPVESQTTQSEDVKPPKADGATIPPSETPVEEPKQEPPAITKEAPVEPRVDTSVPARPHTGVAAAPKESAPVGIQPANSAILPLAAGLIITLFLLMMLSCRLRYMNQRLRYGRLKTHAHDADYLINGMYL